MKLVHSKYNLLWILGNVETPVDSEQDILDELKPYSFDLLANVEHLGHAFPVDGIEVRYLSQGSLISDPRPRHCFLRLLHSFLHFLGLETIIAIKDFFSTPQATQFYQ